MAADGEGGSQTQGGWWRQAWRRCWGAEHPAVQPAPSLLPAGRQAEDRALAYLQQQGLRLVERNYRAAPGRSRRGGEIDLIVREPDGTLVFVEVRQRRGDHHGGAAASVTAAKQRRLVLAAQHYLQTWPAPPPAALMWWHWTVDRFNGCGPRLTPVEPAPRCAQYHRAPCPKTAFNAACWPLPT